jgi:hypothetical protein
MHAATLEQEHHQPAPILIIPDVVKNEGTPQELLEYNYLSTYPEFDMTVHCYPHKHPDERTDVLLPKGIHKCTFYEGQFWCE